MRKQGRLKIMRWSPGKMKWTDQNFRTNWVQLTSVKCEAVWNVDESLFSEPVTSSSFREQSHPAEDFLVEQDVVQCRQFIFFRLDAWSGGRKSVQITRQIKICSTASNRYQFGLLTNQDLNKKKKVGNWQNFIRGRYL